MTAWTGFQSSLHGASPWQNSHVTANIESEGYGVYSPSAASASRVQGSSSLTPPGSFGHGANRTGFIPHSYLLDFYNRIQIIPGVLALGNVMSTKLAQAEIWNAYLNASHTITGFSTLGLTDGITVTAPAGKAPPYTFAPLESVKWSVTVVNAGPMSVNAAYTPAFSGAGSGPLVITGNRAIVWRYKPVWEPDGITETLEWMTDVQTAYDGTEQRMRVRTYPRRTMEYLAAATDNQRFMLQNEMWAWQVRPWAVPLWTQGRRLLSGVMAGSSTLSVNVGNAEFEAGGALAIVSTDTQVVESAEIDSISTGIISLRLPVSHNWLAGARLFPLKFAYLNDKETFTAEMRQISTFRCRFQFDAPESLYDAAEPSGMTYRGYPVLDALQHNWMEQLELSPEAKAKTLDYKTGAITTEYESQFPTLVQQLRIPLLNSDQIITFKKWLHSRMGRLTPFWLPAPHEMGTVVEPIGPTDLVITVANANYASVVSAQQSRRDIRIELKNGTVFHRRITGAVWLDDYTESLMISASLGATVQPSDIRRVCYLLFSRLDADRIEIKWVSPDFATTNVPVRALNNDA